MRPPGSLWGTVLTVVVFAITAAAAAPGGDTADQRASSFPVHGVIQKLRPADLTLVVAHEAITNYMDAMTMPFKVRHAQDLSGLQAGDRITFRLCVTENESWIDQIKKVGSTHLMADTGQPTSDHRAVAPPVSPHPLRDYKFTNELGQAASLGDFQGRALAITFMFTRCPVPDYCPRLAKNFQEASRKLSAMPGAPTNWHFLSVSFDTAFDTPQVLKAYADRYEYDPEHWSFLTGPPNKIAELARLSDATFERDGNFFNHNFRTLIIDPSGRLRTAFPIGGDLSDAIAAELLAAATAGDRQHTDPVGGSPKPPDATPVGFAGEQASKPEPAAR